jgi:peptide/nickel transport system permease protein
VRAYLLKRLLLIPVTLLGVTLITFLVMKLAPGDPAQAIKAQAAGGTLSAAEANVKALEQWRAERHLDKPIYEQYKHWLQDFVKFDLGRSFLPPRERVIDRILDALPITIVLNLISFVLIYLVALPVGIVCAATQFSLWDRTLTISVFLLYSIPTFWLGALMLQFLCPPFPTTGYQPHGIAELGLLGWIGTWSRHLVLPVLCMTYAGFAFLSRQMRSALLEQVRQDFVRTARAKGLPERVVILRHAVRNALIPIITLFGNLLPEMIAGSVIIEYLFSIPGMGQLFFASILERDYPMIMGIETISAVLTLIGILVSDLLYVVVNPTIAYE